MAMARAGMSLLRRGTTCGSAIITKMPVASKILVEDRRSNSSPAFQDHLSNKYAARFATSTMDSQGQGMPQELLTKASVLTPDRPLETAKDLYEKILHSTEAKDAPPNSWTWSLIKKCGNKSDIDLLFQALENLRKFRLSSLRIPENFNSHLCERVAEACARTDAFDYGLKTLWKHNKYGLTPSIASANHLLRRAKEKNNYKLMKLILYVLEKNDLPLQPVTADLVFSICYNRDKWDLITLYSRKFLDAGVKLHRSTFDTWMEFAANRGDAPSIWQIEKLRSKSIKHQTVSSALSCAKGFLLERKPDSAAAIIHAANQALPDSKKPHVEPELQKLISDWPLEVGKRVEGDKMAFMRSLKEDIHAMMEALTMMGLQVVINMDGLKQELTA